MTEPEPKPADQPPPENPPENATPTAEEAPAADYGSVLPWLCAIGFVLLAGGLAFVWWQARIAASPQAGQVASLQQQIQALDVRIDQLEHRPTGTGADLAPLTARVKALEARPEGDLKPLEARVAALEQRQAPDLKPLEAQIADLQQKAQTDQQMLGRVDALSAAVDALSGQASGLSAQVAQRLGADEARIAAQEHASADIVERAKQIQRLARIVAAEAALNLGQPLGELAGAPPGVARFATAAPPTEASLRLGFPKARDAALAAARPDTEGKPFLAQMAARAEGLVTIRQGEHVVVGNPVAGVLEHAQDALDAGDLAGAVKAVGALSGPPAAAMAGWRAEAQSLLAARDGLATMAAHP